MKLVLAFLLSTVSAHAATYTLSGSRLTSCDSPGEDLCEFAVGTSFDGEIRIKGRKLGGLANRDLWWGAAQHPGDLPDGITFQRPRHLNIDLPALFSISTHFPLDPLFKNPEFYSLFHLVTGERGRVLDWSLEILNGSPEYRFKDGTLKAQWNSSYWSGEKGELTRGKVVQPAVAESPLPAAGLLLIGGLGVLAWIAKRKTNA